MKSKLYLGIDVSKGYADFKLLDGNRKVVGEPFQFYDIHEAYQTLDNYFNSLVVKYNPMQILAAVESTGSLENHWLDLVYELGKRYPVKIARLNPLGVSKHRQADMKVQITDRSSSEAIARYLINHEDRISYYSPDAYDKYRRCLSHIELLSKNKTRLTNKLHQHLYQYFPEIVPYIRSKIPLWVYKLLEKYPTSELMSKARFRQNSSLTGLILKKWLLIRERCKLRSYESSDPMAEIIIRDTSRQILDYMLRIDRYYELLGNQLPAEQLKILESMPGVGRKLAISYLCIIGDLDRFNSPHQIVGYFGLYPVIRESGDGKKKPHMSKKGNTLLRKKLYLSALSACHSDSYLSQRYQSMLERGMAKKSAICSIMKKMLRMMYGMLRTMQCYNVEVDALRREQYEQRVSDRQHSELESGLHRQWDELLMIVPISRSNAHHRKEQARAYMQTRSPG